MPEQATVELTVFNASGRKVRTLLGREERLAGHHSVHWDCCDDAGRRVESGVYLFRLEAGGRRETGKAVLVR